MSTTDALSGMPNKRRRRSPGAMDELRHALVVAVGAEHPTTCRSVFYKLVSAGVIEKDEREYQGTVIRLLTELRRNGSIPFGWITDGTRLRRKPRSFSSLGAMLHNSRELYRRDLWDNQDAYVEIWSEKEAIAGVLYQETFAWDVPLLVCKGYPSISYLHAAAEEIAAQGKPAFLYYFGDWDPSGKNISETVERDLRAFAPRAEIHFERVAVTPEQIEEWNLPTRPTKKSDSRSKTFDGRSVEVDAIPTAKLRELAEAAIVQHLDAYALERTRTIEAAERETLDNIIISRFGGAA